MKTDHLIQLTSNNSADGISDQAVKQASQNKRMFNNLFTSPIHGHFLPYPLRSPLAGYLTALLLQALVATGLTLLMKIYPTFQFAESFVLLVVLLTALGWGVGPSLFATFIGILALIFFALPPYFSFAVIESDNQVGLLLYVVVSLAVSLLASQTQRARLALETEKESLHKSEQEAQARAQQLEAIFETMTDGIFVYDADGYLRQTNEAARLQLARYLKPEDFLLSLEERARNPFQHASHGKPLPIEQIPSVRIMNGETLTGANTADIIMNTFTGEDLWLNVSGTPLRDDAGKITGALAISHDVTTRRHLEKRTKEVLEALLQIAEVMVQGAASDRPVEVQSGDHSRQVMQRMAELTQAVLGCDRLGINRVEPNTERLRPLAVVGLPPEQEKQWWRDQEAIDMRLSDSSNPEVVQRLRANEIVIMDMTQPPYNTQPNPYNVRQVLIAPMILMQYPQTDQKTHLEAVTSRPDLFSAEKSERSSENNSQILGYLTLDYVERDHTYTSEELALTRAVTELITLVMERERLLTETAQARANELAALSANQLKDEFIGIAGHELRTPITTMKANLQLARRRLNKFLQQTDTEQQPLQSLEQLLERAERQLERQSRLVHDLLDVSRLEQGHLELRLEQTDLITIVREAVEEQHQITPDRTLLVDLPSTEIHVEVDQDRINQVISNYLSNALKYSAADCPVKIKVDVNNGNARVSILDQGPGLSPDVIQHIWERFYRVPGIQVQSGSGVGLGLGLHISRFIIECQGGMVGVESEVGQGSTFWFTLPNIS